MRGTTLADGTAKSGERAPRRGWLDRHEKAIFLVPPVAAVLLLSIFPLIASLGLSFTFWDFSRPQNGLRFAGLFHWAKLLRDEHFLAVARTTILYMVVAVPVQYVLGMGLALLLNASLRGQGFFRLLFLLPMMLSPVSVAFIVGRMMFDETQGPVNGFLRAFGLGSVQWLSSGKMAFWTVLIVDSWQWIPFMLLLLLAGMQALPTEVMEAARLDARSAWQVFRHVTFPLLLPWSATAVLLRSVEMLKIVDVVTVMTNGGPGISTESLTLYAYRVGLKATDVNYASVIAYVLLIFAIIVSTLFLLGMRRYIQRVSE